MAQAIYGIKSITFATVVPGSFPTFAGEDAFKLNAIVKDSFSFTDSAPSKNNIEIEDSDEYFAILNSDKGTRGFSFQIYDMGEDMFKKLMGYEEKTEDTKTWITEPVSDENVKKEYAVQIETMKQGSNTAKIFQWARMEVTITRSGTLGKSGFPNFNIECVKLANINSSNVETAGARWRNADAE